LDGRRCLNFPLGIDRQKYDFDEAGFWSYLRGHWRQGGWWYYHLYALAIKEPLGTWLLAMLALAAPFAASGRKGNWRDELLVRAPAAARSLRASDVAVQQPAHVYHVSGAHLGISGDNRAMIDRLPVPLIGPG
jgi:hypothetical protein